MLSLRQSPCRLCDGVPRREALRVGGLTALGLSLPQLWRAQTAAAAQPQGGAAFGRARSVILFWLTGGPPQHETWDPKPEAPEEVRGEFGAIATRTPGLQVGELMPRTAQLTQHIAVLRAVVSGDNSHSSSGYQMLTGVPHQPLSQENATPKPPNLAPSLGALVRAVRPQRGGLPAAITIPRHIANVGEILWPGQDAGLLGRKYDPWLIDCDPSAPDFDVPDLALPEGLPEARFGRRRALLAQLDAQFRRADRSGALERYGQQEQQAFDLLRGAGARRAFKLSDEPDAVRDRYGRSKFAQSVLLARRLVEAGASLVQVNWQRIEGKENHGSWDTHKKHSACLKEFLMPMMDQAYAALLEDLLERGMLEETLVAWVGEFGHTPKFNRNAGRDHWGRVFSVALAGGGIRGGTVHGASDARAAEPRAGRVAPRDIAATIFHCLGHHAEQTVPDPLGRPYPLSRGRVIEQIV